MLVAILVANCSVPFLHLIIIAASSVVFVFCMVGDRVTHERLN